MQLDFISLAQQSQAHRSYSVNTCGMNEWPREIYVCFCPDNSELPTNIPLFMRPGPTGTLSQRVGPPRRKVTWAMYAIASSLRESPYTFNNPGAWFSKTDTKASLGQETHIQKPVSTLQNRNVLFFTHSASIDHLPNACCALSNPVVIRTICPWELYKASGGKTHNS